MVMTERRLTADEYLALPLEDRHTQLIDGEIVDLALEVGAGEELTTPLLPGFALDLAALFDR
jgi:hypothetical protein